MEFGPVQSSSQMDATADILYHEPRKIQMKNWLETPHYWTMTNNDGYKTHWKTNQFRGTADHVQRALELWFQQGSWTEQQTAALIPARRTTV